MSFYNAYKFVKERRPIIKPNSTFRSELVSLCKLENGQCPTCDKEMTNLELRKHQCHLKKCLGCGTTSNDECKKQCMVCHQMIKCLELKNHLTVIHNLQVP